MNLELWSGMRFIICEKEVQTVEATLKFYYKVCKEENIKSAEDIFVKFSIDSGLEKKRYKIEWLPVTGYEEWIGLGGEYARRAEARKELRDYIINNNGNMIRKK